jgi:hypothetical protein
MIKPNLYNDKNLLIKINEKKYFMLLVFAVLILQINIVHYTFTHTSFKNKKETNERMIPHLWIVTVVLLTIFFISLPSWLKFILFSLFSYSLGIILACMKENDYLKLYIDSSLEILFTQSFTGLLLIFFGIFSVLSIPKFKLTLSQIYFLLYFSLLLLILRIIMKFDSSITMRIRYYTILLFIVIALFFIYDSYNILSRNYNGDFVSASLDYLMDPFTILNKNLERFIFL